jgi:hypothetical protein
MGEDAKLAADVGATVPWDKLGVNKAGKATVDASAGLDGRAEYNSGFVFTFEGTESGRTALIDLVEKLVESETIKASDWVSAKDISTWREGALQGGANVRAGAKFELAGKPNDQIEKQGAGISADISAAASIRGRRIEVSSLNEKIHRGEVEITGTVSAGTSVYAKIYNPLNLVTAALQEKSKMQDAVNKDSTIGVDEKGKSNYKISDGTQSQDLLGITANLSSTYTRRWRQVQDAEGRFTRGEFVHQTTMASGVVSGLSVISKPSLTNLLQDSETDTPAVLSKKAELRDNVRALMSIMGRNDQVAVTYDLKSEVLEAANQLFTRAASAERAGQTGEADKLRSRAQDMMDDQDNYVPKKISVIGLNIQKSEITNINARWVSWSTFSEGKTEHPAAVLSIPS